MNLKNHRFSSKAEHFAGKVLWLQRFSQLSFLLAFALVSGVSAPAQVPLKQDVLILNEVGLSHALTDLMTQQIVSGVQETPGHPFEFYSENLDLLYFPDRS